MTEIELKFLVDKKMARSLSSRLRKYADQDAGVQPRKLRSIYYDTADHDLHKAGVSARLRQDGDRWLRTVKIRRPIRGGLSNADEVETETAERELRLSSIEDGKLRARLEKVASGKPLQPVCETDMLRISGRVSGGNGAIAEVCVDTGQIVANGKKKAFCEVELELIEGEVASLYDLAGILMRGIPLRFSTMSKAERGYLFASNGAIDAAAAPRKAEVAKISADMPIASAEILIFGECLEQIAANIIVVGQNTDPEGPHQLRIGLRRFRSALAIFEPVMKKRQRRWFEKQTRWIGAKIGELRNMDVAIADIVKREMTHHPNEPGMEIILRSLQKAAKRERKKIRALLQRQRVSDFLLELSRYCACLSVENANGREASTSAADLMEASLETCWNSVKADTGNLDRLSERQRHDLRKKLKKLRYVAEFAAPMYDKARCSKYLKLLKSLQDLFGNLNDAVMVRALFDSGNVKGCDGREAQRAIGIVIGSHMAAARVDWEKVKGACERLEREGAFWSKAVGDGNAIPAGAGAEAAG